MSSASYNMSKIMNYMKNNVNQDEIFGGGRISTFSAKFGNDPVNFNFKKMNDPADIGKILKYDKVIPNLPKNYSGVTANYIYCYLDPFKPAPTDYGYIYKLPFAINGVNELRFGYEPFYIGKGISSTGHRFNQHLADYINKNPEDLENQLKQERFANIEKKMYAASGIAPRNWNDYKENWIKIIFEFNDTNTLNRNEKILINTIGSINGLKKGPLVNISSTKSL